MNKGLSTLTEILLRGKIYEIYDSYLCPDVKIIIFVDGSQANVDEETYHRLTADE